MRAPSKIYDESGLAWELAGRASGPVGSLEYKSQALGVGAIVRPGDVETQFTRSGRPEPSSEIVRQGRWECGASALAMLLGESLWDVKRAAVAAGWNNDDRGLGTAAMIQAARILGHSIAATAGASASRPQVIMLPSLNLKNSRHAVYWDGRETLDPNWGYPGRKWWGVEWSPETIGSEGPAIVRLGASPAQPDRNHLL
jgi:hypothetical protein